MVRPLLLAHIVAACVALACALRQVSLDEVLADPSVHYVQGSWLHGPPRDQVDHRVWMPGDASNCEFPRARRIMTCCPANSTWEALSNGRQLCRNADGSGNWSCAPGWVGQSGGPANCINEAANACEADGFLGAVPCGPLPSNHTRRVLSFRSGFYRLLLDVDTLQLNVSLAARSASWGPWGALFGAGGPARVHRVITPTVSVDGAEHSCVGPQVATLGTGGYPVRLVRQGRYLAHWWIGGVQCGSVDAVVEVKVWPDCFELHLSLGEGHRAIFRSELGEVSAGSGFAMAAFCKNCPEPSCQLEQARHTPKCCPLGEGACRAGPSTACGSMAATEAEWQHGMATAPEDVVKVLDMVHAEAAQSLPSQLKVGQFISVAWQGANSFFCADPVNVPSHFPLAGSILSASFLPVDLVAAGNIVPDASHDAECATGQIAYCLPLQATTEVRQGAPGGVLDVAFVPPPIPMTGEGCAIKVALPPHGDRSLHANDPHRITLQNPGTAAVNVRLVFHIDNPRGMSGIASLLRDAGTKAGSGMHVQISKNWHTDAEGWQELPYHASWYSAVVLLRLPPQSRLAEAELLLVYQFFEAYHSVSHAQLSLVGWGFNGLWEEVGLGSTGESICYEADGQQRRSLVNDVRPFLVCGMGSSTDDCQGSVEATRWTDNHGGMDFLIAVNSTGSYQYLTDVRAHHVANGPKLTNVSYTGVTADGALYATRTVSTWTTDDFQRHLHSFHVEALKDVAYPRLVLYQLGADHYNQVAGARLALGDGGGFVQEVSETLPFLSYSQDVYQRACYGTLPCWFALLAPEALAESHFAHRGLIVRRWQARLGGIEQPLHRGFSFSLKGVEKGGVGLELSLPAGAPPLVEGDFISADLEVFLYPKNATVYYGYSQQLRRWLAGSQQEPWRIAFQEATATDFSVQVRRGSLERRFPLRVRAAESGLAEFDLMPATAEKPGVLIVSVAGVGSRGGRLWHWWRWDNPRWVQASSAGDCQVDHEAGQGYTFTHTVRLEAGGLQEAFAFGPEAPGPPSWFTAAQDGQKAAAVLAGCATVGLIVVAVVVARAAARRFGHGRSHLPFYGKVPSSDVTRMQQNSKAGDPLTGPQASPLRRRSGDVSC